MSGKAFIDHFSALEDPRQAWKVVYPLPEILLLVLCATLAGAEDFVEIARWGQAQARVPAPAPALRARHRLARHAQRRDERAARDALRRLLHRLGGEPARERARHRGHRRQDLAAAHRRKGSDPLHLVSAWASRQRLVLGQEAVAEKSNEITAIPLLLERLELDGALVTIDAMGCQTEIAKAIRAKGADYLLALKDNWPALAEEVERFFDDRARRHPRPATRPPTATMAASRSAATPSATTSPGSPPTGASPASGASRPRHDRHGRGRGRARRQDQHRAAATISPPPRSPPRPSPPPSAPTGASRTACTGSWTSSSTTTSCACAPATDPPTWPPSATRPSTSSRQIPDKASLKVRRKTLGWDDDYLLAALTQPRQ